MVDAQFYEYISVMLRDAGHMITSAPIYANHNAAETLYIDSNRDVATSKFDRELLMRVCNVSLLVKMTWPTVVEDLSETVFIYSITVDAPIRDRSQIVADSHRLLQQFWNCNHSVVFFKNRNQYIISFADKDQSHILSDWFDINLGYDEVVERIDTADMTMESCGGYFEDFIYAVARAYYIYPISVENATYGMIPLNYVASAFGVETGVSKDDIKALARENLSAYELQYGDDYVAPVYIGVDEQAQFRRMAIELDKISFELELAEEFGDEDQLNIYDDNLTDDLDDEYVDDYSDDWDADIDPAIFDDPVLMVKWLEKQQRKSMDSSSEVTPHSSKSDLDRLEAERLDKQ